MTKRFGFILVALMILSALLAACGGSESRDNAEDYFEAVLKGDIDGAKGKICDSDEILAETEALVAIFKDMDVHAIDIQLDEGKGGNQEEIIITGSFDLGEGEDADEIELAQTFRDDDGEDYDTRVILEMREDGDDWCVNGVDENELFEIPELAGEAEGEQPETPEGTDEPSTEETPAPTDEGTSEDTGDETPAPADEETPAPADDEGTSEEATPAATSEDTSEG